MADLITPAMIEDDMDVVDGLASVTVRQINPDTGATLATALDVPRLRRVVSHETQGVAEGEVAVTKARHHLKSKPIPFVVKKRDEIEDANGTWVIDSVQAVSFGTRYVCETTKKP